jgi:hypothetical protein
VVSALQQRRNFSSELTFIVSEFGRAPKRQSLSPAPFASSGFGELQEEPIWTLP